MAVAPVFVQKFPDSEFPDLFCRRLFIKPATTNFKWSTEVKNKDFIILGNKDQAKTIGIKAEEQGILGTIPMVLGTDIKNWKYEIAIPGTIHVGLAEITQSMTTVKGALFDVEQKVNSTDNIAFSLGLTTFTIRHQTEYGDVVSTNTFSIIPHVGKTAYNWLSTDSTSSTSVKVFEDVKFQMISNSDGAAVMTGTNSTIVDFAIDDLLANDDTTALPGLSNTTLNNNGAGVTVVNDDDDINLIGGISYKIEDITAAIGSVVLTRGDYMITISNPLTTEVKLPPASLHPGQAYLISRNYISQVGETVGAPVLSVVPDAPDTIEGDSSIGLLPSTSISLVSDGLLTWRIR